MNSSYNNMRARSRLDIVNQTYNGEVTPKQLEMHWTRIEDPTVHIVEEQLRKRIKEMETDW